MGIYILRRLAVLVPTLFGVSLLVFTLMRLIPGDPVQTMLGMEVSGEAVEAVRAQYGLDQPLPIQYFRWLGRAVQGDLGMSIITKKRVSEIMLEKLPATLELAVASMAIALLIALPAGVVMATRRNSWADYAGTLIALFGVSMPNFWLGISLILILAVWLRWLPPSGFVPFPNDPIGNLRLLVMPAITLGAALAAVLARLTRASMLDVLKDDYVRTARSKGLDNRAVIYGHALRNALLPIVTVAGIQIGHLLGGAVITETIFAWPGLGKLAVDSITSRDFPVVQGVVLFSAAIFVVVNLIVDLLYLVLDPRIRY